jgi:hypothetical protein
MKYHTIIILLTHFIGHSLCQIVYNLIGGVTDSSFQIKGKVKDQAILNLYQNNILVGSYNPDGSMFYFIKVENLNASTLYQFKLNQNSGQITDTLNFNVTTFPPQGSSSKFNFIAGSNIYSNTKSFIFDRILSKSPAFFMLLGNLHTDGEAKEENTINGILNILLSFDT